MTVPRMISGLVLMFITIGLVIAGPFWTALGIFVLFGTAQIEFAQLAAKQGYRASGELMLAWLLLFLADRLLPEKGLLEPGISLLMLITFTWTIIRYRQGTTNAIVGFALTLTGSIYIGWSAAHLLGLRTFDPDGIFWFFTAWLATVMADSCAYIVGMNFGRNKLIPDISPGKTWEGYIGGIICTILIIGALMLLWQRLGGSSALTPIHGMFIGGLAATVGPIGDLGISVLKRYANVKNTSNLIPGHGGVLDRIDALLISCLVSYYYLTLVVL